MMTFQERKELEEKKESLMNEFWKIAESSEFAKAMQRLCNASDSYATADARLERYEEQSEQDKSILQDFQDDVLRGSVGFYSEFVSFFKKYSSESSRVHSKMGSAKSEKKASASRENGKKGGRPRKSANIIAEGKQATLNQSSCV